MIAGLKPYAEYKESGLPWLGQLPAHWEVARSKRLFTARQELARPDDVQLSATQAYGVIAQSQYEERSGYRVVKISMHLDKRRHVEADDFVISMRSFQGGLERAWVTGAIRSSYVVLQPDAQVDATYFRHLFKSAPYIGALRATADFIRDGQDLNYSNFCDVDLPLIPHSEQAAIGRFLDWAHGRLERAIRAKRKVIALLNEQKQAVIQRAVTRGLDRSAPLKPSGIPWLGDIPAHWDTPLNQRVFRENSRPQNSVKETPLSLSQRDGLIATSDMKERSLQTASYDNWKVVLPGDLVVNRFKAHLGVFFAATRRGIVSFHYGVFAPRTPLDTKYFELLFHTTSYRTIFAGRSNGMTVGLQNLSNQNFYSVRVAVPPLDEQIATVSLAERETQSVRTAIGRLEREIELLREYRTRLVADIVTGKLDVREAATRLPDDQFTPEDDNQPDELDFEEEATGQPEDIA